MRNGKFHTSSLRGLASRGRVYGSAAALALGFMLAGCQSNADKAKSDAANGQVTKYQAAADAADHAFAEGAKQPAKPRTLYSLAKILCAQGRDREAATVLMTLIERHRNFLPAYNALAEIHMRADRPEDAVAALTAGLRQRPGDPVLANNLGMVYVVQGHYQQALQQFDQALAANPKEHGLLANKAMALGMLGRTDEAAEIYGQIMTPLEARENLRILAKARGTSSVEDSEDGTDDDQPLETTTSAPGDAPSAVQ